MMAAVADSCLTHGRQRGHRRRARGQIAGHFAGHLRDTLGHFGLIGPLTRPDRHPPVFRQPPTLQYLSCYGSHLGALAQLGEHLLCKQGVIGSIPIRST